MHRFLCPYKIGPQLLGQRALVAALRQGLITGLIIGFSSARWKSRHRAWLATKSLSTPEPTRLGRLLADLLADRHSWLVPIDPAHDVRRLRGLLRRSG